MVVAGAGQLELEDELVDVGPGDVLRVAPELLAAARPVRTGEMLTIDQYTSWPRDHDEHLRKPSLMVAGDVRFRLRTTQR